MLRAGGAICGAFLAFGNLFAQEDLREQLDRPYVSLFGVSDFQTSGQPKSLQSSIERERDEQIGACKSDEKRLRAQLKLAHRSLANLNESSSSDSAKIAAGRGNLHNEVAALERLLRDKGNECRRIIPAIFEIKLAKWRVLDRWPKRREKTNLTIEQGRARERKHGDIEDIGYRKIASHREKDIAVGAQVVRQMASRGMPREVRDPVVRQYIEALAATIAGRSDLKLPLHVTVLDSAEVTAIGLPGGFLFVSSGLVAAAGTESELAGVLSREIAHIAARHGVRGSKLSIISKTVVPALQIAANVITANFTKSGVVYGIDYGSQGLGVLAYRELTASNVKAQKEADQLGIQYAWNAGFDPKGFVAFLDSVSKERDYSRTGGFLVSRPALGERLIDAFTEIEYLPVKRNYTVDSLEFQNVKKTLSLCERAPRSGG